MYFLRFLHSSSNEINLESKILRRPDSYSNFMINGHFLVASTQPSTRNLLALGKFSEIEDEGKCYKTINI